MTKKTVRQRRAKKRMPFTPEVDQELVCVPAPEPFESPASWLSRLALSQAATVWAVLAHLKIDLRGDIDIQFAACDLDRVARLCGIPESSFSFMRYMFSQLQRIDARGEVYLLSHDTFARYRFCDRCLKEQRTPYFPLHWRFKAWRWCPLHTCLMRDHCPRCKAILVLPIDLLHAGRRRAGVAYLSSCAVCGARLTNKPKAVRFEPARNNLTVKEHLLLANGRALLAALYHNEFGISSKPERYPLRGLYQLERNGHLPHKLMHYEKFELMEEPRYRHPVSNELCGRSDQKRQPGRKRFYGGLFD